MRLLGRKFFPPGPASVATAFDCSRGRRRFASRAHWRKRKAPRGVVSTLKAIGGRLRHAHRTLGRGPLHSFYPNARWRAVRTSASVVLPKAKPKTRIWSQGILGEPELWELK